MGIGNLFFNYQPTGAFSFEFRERNADTGAIGRSVAEFFFMNPPEEYQISEAYKVAVQKTIGGVWVDDYGNDVKKISLSGSIYNFLTGVPPKPSNGASAALGTITDAMIPSAKKLVEQTSALSGVNGFEDFLKLRYIVSRFRDNKAAPTENEKKAMRNIMKSDPKQDFESGPYYKQFSKKARNSEYAIIYHDYDDDNHFVVIFENFTSKRGKEDPFTINWAIEMTGIDYAESKALQRKFNPKEGAMALAGVAFKTTNAIISVLSDVVTGTSEIMSIPVSLLGAASSLLSAHRRLAGEITNFINGVVSYPDRLKAIVDSMRVDLTVFTNSTLTQNGATIDNIKVEDDNVPFQTLSQYDIAAKMAANKATVDAINATYKAERDALLKRISDSDTTRAADIEAGSSLSEDDFPLENTNGGQALDKIKTKDYVVQQNDTNLYMTSLHALGYYAGGRVIGELNSLTNRSFDNGALIGKTIKIPDEAQPSGAAVDYNLVYTNVGPGATPQEIQTAVLGTDINLSNVGGIIVDSSGDIGSLYGTDTFMANINDRLSNREGSLAPLHPEWGMPLIFGDAPDGVILTKVIEAIVEQVNADPRTAEAVVDYENVEQIADTLRIPLKIKTITGSEENIDAGKFMPLV